VGEYLQSGWKRNERAHMIFRARRPPTRYKSSNKLRKNTVMVERTRVFPTKNINEKEEIKKILEKLPIIEILPPE